MAETRIQLCGRLVARIDARRIEDELPGRQGRLAFAYLAVNRHRAVSRDELADALWDEPAALRPAQPAALEAAASSRSTAAARSGSTLPDDAWLDVEAASEGLHRAEGAVAQGDFARGLGPGRVAQHIASREFLPGEDGAWIDEQRRRLDELHVRSLELVGRACVEIGGGELDTAERAARALDRPRAATARAGTGSDGGARGARQHRGGAARLRHPPPPLRDELGASPSAATQAIYRRLLG